MRCFRCPVSVCTNRPAPHRLHKPVERRARVCVCKSSSTEEVPDASYGFVAQNAGLVRTLPLWTGGLGLVGILLNRAASGIAPVVDASSAQSRADVLGIVLSASLLLTGLQWLSLKAKPPVSVELQGSNIDYADTRLPKQASQELRWTWEALSRATATKSMVVFFQNKVVFQAGMAQQGVEAGQAALGEVVRKAIQSGQGNYLPNLVLYPGRVELVQYLPENTQAVIIQPMGKAGALVLGTGTQRGFGRMDQAWIATIADKLENTLEGFVLPGTGFSAPAQAAGKANSIPPQAGKAKGVSPGR